MAGTKPARLFDLLPEIYRVRDADPPASGALQALLDVVDHQVGTVRDDITHLLDNFFIETCDEWVIPYIGDLLGTNLVAPVVLRARTDVAKTIHYRRRKGTLPGLEELARDVTGWSAKVVEFFQALGWTQNMNHVRLDHGGWFGVQNDTVCNAVGTAFDRAAHSIDVRTPVQDEGWYNIVNVGFFLWRLQVYSLVHSDPRVETGQPHRFHFNALGQPLPLFIQPDIGSLAEQATDEDDVRGAISTRRLQSDPTIVARYYGQRRGFGVYVDGTLVSPDAAPPAKRAIVIGDLCAWADPAPGTLVIDVQLGRFAFAPGETPPGRITVSFNYGFSGDIGAGPYARRLTEPATVRVGRSEAVTTLKAALDAWAAAPPDRAVIEITDSATYAGALTPLALPATPFHLTIRAASEQRPAILLGGDWLLTGGAATSSLTLDGVFISGGQIDLQGTLGELTVRNCTLDPGGGLSPDGVTSRPMQRSLVVAAANDQLAIAIDHSITGALRIPRQTAALRITDSIVDAQGDVAISSPGGANDFAARSTIRATTIFGQCRLQELLLGSEMLFDDVVTVARRQIGCVRFSYLAPGSVTPRIYECVPPDGATPAEQARLAPEFTSRRFGDPGYAQLSRSGPSAIATGAANGSEIGAFSSLLNPLREQNLQIRLDEYLPFGLVAVLIYVT